MNFETVDSEERERIESGSDALLSNRYGNLAILLMQGEMVWTEEWRAAMCLSKLLRRRGWKLHYKNAYRSGVNGRYFWAERREQKP